MKPICVPCQRFYRMKKSGYYFIESMPKAGGDPRPLAGTTAPSSWTPYKVWSGDLWECEGCHTQIVSGTGQNALAEHYQPEFAAVVARLGADQLHVNDC